MEEAVDPIVEQVLAEPPVEDAAAMETEAPSETPTSTATEQPAPETAVEAADGKDDAKPAAAAAAAAAKDEDPPKKAKRKETRKRVRRVGKSEPRKFAKMDTASLNNPSGEGTMESLTGAAARADGGTPTMATRRVLSKHDEKWNNMFDKLLEYKVR